METFREILEKERKKAGFSWASLSRAAGLGDAAIKHIMRNPSQSPKVDTIERLARALKLSPAELMGSAWQKPAAVEKEKLQIIIEWVVEAQNEEGMKLSTKNFAKLIVHNYVLSLKDPSFTKESLSNGVQLLLEDAKVEQK